MILSLSSGCGRSSSELFDAMMEADDNEQIRFISAEIMDQGGDGIPILLAILSRDVPPDRRLSLIELSKDGAALTRLNDLAVKGVYTIHEIPVLLEYMDAKMVNLQASLIPADTLQRITGLDVGYNSQFVSGFSKELEPKRQKMLSAWRAWYDDRR